MKKRAVKSRVRRPRVHPEVKDLLNDVTAFCEERGLTRTRFGLKIANDGHFLRRLEQGRMSSLHTLDRVRKFISR